VFSSLPPVKEMFPEAAGTRSSWRLPVRIPRILAWSGTRKATQQRRAPKYPCYRV